MVNQQTFIFETIDGRPFNGELKFIFSDPILLYNKYLPAYPLHTV